MKKTLIPHVGFMKGETFVAHQGDAGWDVMYQGDAEVTLQPLERHAFPTGVSIEFFSDKYTAEVCPRSGLAFNSGVTVLNAPGIVDSGFTGEIAVCLVNLSNEPVTITPGQRIAQLVIRECIPAQGEGVRGDKGFGSSGH